MGLLIALGLRNLLRQKRRNLLLGAAMAIGMAILVIANAFSHGISDVLFNRILAYVAGHVSVAMAQGSDISHPIFRDGPRLREIIRAAVPEAITVEEGLGVFARAVGNGKSDNVMLIGMDPRPHGSARQLADLKSNFRMREGSYDALLRADLENPVLVSSEKAAYLNAKVGDVLRARFQDIHGRSQAARLTVAGIFDPANIFMSVPVFVERDRLKALAGFGPSDIGQIFITLPDPKRQAIRVADALHAALAPPLAAASGTLQAGNGKRAEALALGFLPDSAALRGLASALAPRLPGGRAALSRTDVLITEPLARDLGAGPGDTVRFAYAGKRGPGSAAFAVTGIVPVTPRLPPRALLVNDRAFYGFYYDNWPQPIAPGTVLPDTAALGPWLDREWILLPRTRTTQELQLKRRDIARLKTKAASLDVQTMYESASMVVKLEYALNLITLAAVLVLFFVIQVGIVNTLRMTIRERTREIGAVRAIGMQRSQVRALFLLETFFLASAACVAGIGLAFAAMAGLSRLAFRADGNPLSMLLVDGHPHFLPTAAGAAAYLALILSIAMATAWFPAQRAARLDPVEALRHFG